MDVLPLTEKGRAADPIWQAWTARLARHPQLRFWSDLFDDLLLVVDEEGRIGYASASAERWLGLAAEAVVGTHLSRHVHPLDQYRLPDRIAELTPDRNLDELGPLRFETPQGKTVWLRGRAIDLTGDPGVGGVLLRFCDAAADPGVFDRVCETADRFYKVFRVSPASVAVTTLEERRFIHVNDGFLRLLGYRREEVIGYTAEELEIDVEQEDRQPIYERVRREGSVEGVEAQLRTKGGKICDVFGSYFLIGDGGARHVVHKVFDIATIRRLEREVLQTSERERQRLAHNLHDNVGQLLTAASLRSRTLAQQLKRRRAEEAEHADQVAGLLDHALEALRALSRQMLPAQLEGGGLRGALANFVVEAGTAYDITCAFHAGDVAEITDAGTIAHLYRIVQEAVNNAVRHGKAQRVDVTLAQARGALVLRIEDDGRGLPDEALKEKGEGVGLRSMRYRARLLGASLRVANRKGGGAAIKITLPLQLLPGYEGEE